MLLRLKAVHFSSLQQEDTADYHAVVVADETGSSGGQAGLQQMGLLSLQSTHIFLEVTLNPHHCHWLHWC